ncbi:MAG: DHA2 family efflux MFS transporter permease subunit [Deltaproteobacteria bacterium]|nr:DHA2 family efflux MFS transporter permease subunit [Deltaproteobacteria bacterium]
MNGEEAGPSAAEPEAAWKPRHNPWLIAIVVTMATFMEVLDATIVNVSLPQIAGTLSATQEEATWVLTSYLVANAIVLPVSGWLSSLLGRKRFYMTCVALFTASSLLCGAAPNLGSLVFFRVLQGLGGGGLQPSEQAILVDTFPPAKRGMAFAVAGIAMVTAPILGPTLGGWITDNFSWRWAFYVNLPVGLLSLFLSQKLVQDPPHARRVRFREGFTVDYTGLGLIALGLGCLQVVLDKGQIEDWFASPFIQIFAALAVVGLAAAVWWELGHKHPVVDLRLLRDWNFGTANVLMFAVGFSLYGSTILIPLLLQNLMGYTAMDAGLVISPGGLVVVAMMPIVGKLSSRVQPKWLIAFGLTVLGAALLHMTSFNLHMDYRTVVLARCFQTLGLSFLFVPVNTMAYAHLPKGKNNNASAILNLSRNLGGSFGIALVTMLLARRFQYHHSVLASHVSPLDPQYLAWSEQAGRVLKWLGSADPAKVLALVYQQLQRQAAILSYLDNFWVLGLTVLALVPLTLALRRIPLGRAGHGGH